MFGPGILWCSPVERARGRGPGGDPCNVDDGRQGSSQGRVVGQQDGDRVAVIADLVAPCDEGGLVGRGRVADQQQGLHQLADVRAEVVEMFAGSLVEIIGEIGPIDLIDLVAVEESELLQQPGEAVVVM